MIATVFLDWGLAFGAGVLFAVAGRAETGAGTPALRTRAFRLGAAYLVAGFLPVSLTMYALEPDWMWMYWVSPDALPVAVVVASFAMYAAAYVSGFAVSAEAERTRAGAGIAIAVGTGVLMGAAQIAARTRILHIGTAEQFRAGTAPGILEGGNGLLLAGLLSASCGLLAYLVWRAARGARDRLSSSAAASARRVGSGSR